MKAILALAVLAIGGSALTEPPEIKRPPMHTFVLLFRPGPRPLSEAELKQRAVEIAAWAKQRNDEGRQLEPRVLGQERQWIGPDEGSEPPPDAGSVTNLLFLEARDLADAVEVARSHPGRRFGTSIEVRSASRPPGAPAAPPPGTR